MKLRISIFLLFCITIIFALNRPEFSYERIRAEKPADSLFIFNDSLSYEADSTSVNIYEQQANLLGNSTVYYQTTTIKADTIFMDNEKEIAKANGNIFLLEKDQKMLGDSLIFSIADKRGIVNDGAGKFEQGYFYGDEVRKISDNTYDMTNGIFTSCDAEIPHFYIKSKKMRIYRNDKVVARPAIFYANHFPVFALPFGAFNIKRGRVSGFLMPSPSMNSTDGKFLEDMAYYYAFKDYADLLFSVSVYEKTGFELNFDTDYIKKYRYNGDLSYSYRDRNTNTTTWHWRQNHTHNFDNLSIFKANLNFASSKTVYSTSNDVEERTQQSLSSSLTYTFYLWNKKLNMSSSYRHNLYTDTRDVSYLKTGVSFASRPITELIPESVDAPDFLDKLSVSYSTNFAHSGTINGSDPDFNDYIHTNQDTLSDGREISEQHLGIKHTVRTSYKYKLLWFNMNHSALYYENWYDRDKNNNKYVRANAYSFSNSMNFSIYGLKYFNSGPITALRHIVRPSISHSFRPDFSENNIYETKPYSILSGDKTQSFSFSINQKWQVKLPAKKNENTDDSDNKNSEVVTGKERVINDLLGLTSSFSYNPYADGKGLSDLNHNFDLKSLSFAYGDQKLSFSQDFGMTQDIYNFEILRYNFSSNLSLNGKAEYTTYFPEEENKFDSNVFTSPDSLKGDEKLNKTFEWLNNDEKWDSKISHSYSVDNQYKRVTQNYLSFSTKFKLSANWQFDFKTSYDFKTNKMNSYTIDLSRKLHCWKLNINIYKSSAYWKYSINFFDIKLQDALKLKFQDNSN